MPDSLHAFDQCSVPNDRARIRRTSLRLHRRHCVSGRDRFPDPQTLVPGFPPIPLKKHTVPTVARDDRLAMVVEGIHSQRLAGG